MLKDFGVHIEGHDKLELLLDATKERGKTLVELSQQISLILNAPESYNEKDYKKAIKEDTKMILNDFIVLLRASQDSLHLPCDYHTVLEKLVSAKEIGFGKIGQPLRVALLGSMTGAGLDEIMAILGVEETVKRIDKLLSTL